MFFQLSEIDKTTQHIDQLAKNKDKIQSFLSQSYSSQPKVKQSLTDIVNQISKFALSKSQSFQKVQQRALEGTLLPDRVQFQNFVQNQQAIPEWTKTVFQKQFQKQKKSLDIVAKKLYVTQGLSQIRVKHKQQLISFKNICDRFHALSAHDQTIDIMAEADKVKSLTKITNQRYLSYLLMVSSKIQGFVSQLIQKCSNFGMELNLIGNKTTNQYTYIQRNKNLMTQPRNTHSRVQINTNQNWLSRANRTLDRGFLSKTKGSYNQPPVWQPKYLNNTIQQFYS